MIHYPLPFPREELLAMPESAYMDEAQIEFFRALLLQQKAELVDNARLTGEHLRETEANADPSDRATQEEEHALELRVRDRERKLMSKIDQALARLDDGAYGYCQDTGDPIGLPRLLARPTATLCLEAQERREKQQRLQRD